MHGQKPIWAAFEQPGLWAECPMNAISRVSDEGCWSFKGLWTMDHACGLTICRLLRPRGYHVITILPLSGVW